MIRSAFLLLTTCLVARAQLVDDYRPPRIQDWSQLSRYYADNEALKRLPPDPLRVVFMGDSITDNWRLADWFPGKPYVNRGIGGQTTPQMLVRMYPDVIDLKPAAVVILAGTNDIARNTGPSTLAQIGDNFQAMTDLAQAHGIKVILCSVTPISDYGRSPQSSQRPPADILRLNAWLKDFATKTHAVYADYYSALVDERGMLRIGFSVDGLHPNVDGYRLLAPVAEAAIRKALQ